MACVIGAHVFLLFGLQEVSSRVPVGARIGVSKVVTKVSQYIESTGERTSTNQYKVPQYKRTGEVISR